MALAGGVSVRVPQRAGYLFQQEMIFSPDGHCRSFDAKANGTVFGSGVGAVLLKRLADALADRDPILAVIRGSAVNNDGSAKVAYTAPSLERQAAVIVEALDIAGVDPGTVGYVEAHGTGTALGDPIEIAALKKAFRAYTSEKGFCAVGSVKTNVGHLNVAAGIASLIKTVLALRHKQIPPCLHFEQPNPEIDFENSPFFVNATLAGWKAGKTPRRAGVSAFGVGGTNAHVVLEETPFLEPSDPSKPWQLLLLSAKSLSALETATSNLAEHIKQHPGLNLADVAYTLKLGRSAMKCRRVAVCRDQDDAVSVLQTLDPKRVVTSLDAPKVRPVVFMFTGQGAQYIGMARELYETERIFRQHIDHCSEFLRPHLGLDLRSVFYPRDNRVDEATQKLTQTAITQPALFAIEYALARLLMEWGIQPQAMIGHSIGEYVAACFAGVFSLEDGLMLVATRGRLMNQLPAGSMLAIPLPEKEVQPLLGGELSLATINAPTACVVSGPSKAIEQLEKKLIEQDIEGRRLHTSHAFHSCMMEPILDSFKDQVRKIRLNAPKIPYLSNVTGTWITREQATDPNYWARHLRQTVRFSDGVGELLKESGRVFLEVGPGETLASLTRRHPDKATDQVILSSVRHPRLKQSDVAFLLRTMGRLWLAGIEVNWTKSHEGERRHRVALPTYPFERQRYWVEPAREPSDDVGMKRTPASSTKRQHVNDWFYVPCWKQSMKPPPHEENGRDLTGTRWLVFVDADGLGSQLASQLEQKNHEVVTVRAGNDYAAHDERSFTIRPGYADDYKTLMETLGSSGRLPAGVLHMWAVSSKKNASSPLADLDTSQQLGFYSLLYLAQALGRQKMERLLRFWVVSSNLYDVTGEEVLEPEKATILGPCKTIPQEYENITCHCLDIDISENIAEQKSRLTGQLLDEINSAAVDPIVAYRGRHRWVLTYEPVKIDPVSEKNPRLREGGVYLITGGMGGIGLVMAKYLARTVKAKLVLVGRSAVPDQDQWEQWLTTHGESDETSRRILKVRALEKLGAEVTLVSADVTSLEQMKQAIAQAKMRFGKINGVIHGAGVPGGGVIQLKSPEVAAKVLAPKVKGTLVLDEVLKDTPLDWFVLCSSTFAITSRFGQVDYCAANSFLDAFAHHKSTGNGSVVISINWDGWREVGMAVNAVPSTRSNAVQSAGRGREIGHPLLEKCILESVDRVVFLTEFSVEKHWVLAEHQVRGNAVVPGTAFLEMTRAAFKDHMKTDSIDISEVFFSTPLIVGATERKEVYTILEKDGDHHDFRVLSRSGSQEGEPPKWEEHARGKICAHKLESPTPCEIGEILKRCDATAINTLDGTHGGGETALVQWGARWQSVSKLYLGKNEVLGELKLPREFSADLDALTMHPALLDLATGLACRYTSDGKYLPFSYEQLTIGVRLPARFFTHVRFNKDLSEKREVVSFDVLLMNEQGGVLAEVKGVMFRRIEDTVATVGAGKGERQQVRSGSSRLPEDKARYYENLVSVQKQHERLDDGILPSEGVDAFERILARCTVPQVVVSIKPIRPMALSESHAALLPSGQSEELFAASSEHARPDLETAYIAPVNEAERVLAEIWQDSLGIAQVGTKDNFFELGGDSVIAIQIIVKAKKSGFQLTVNHIFEHQTIAELAVVGKTDQGTEGKSVGVTDAQTKRFTSDGVDTAKSNVNEFNWTQDEQDAIAKAIKKTIGDV